MNSYWLRRFPPIELFQKILFITPTEEVDNWVTAFFNNGRHCTSLFSQILQLRKASILTSHETTCLLEVLLDIHPETLKSSCKNGFLPIHTFCSSRDLTMDNTEHVLCLLIRSFPESVLIENKGGVTPLQLFFDNHILDDEGLCKIDKHIVQKEFYNHDKLDQVSPYSKLWKCMLLLFRTAASISSHDMINRNVYSYGDTWPLHMIVQSEFLTDPMLDIALDIHHRELGLRDNNGNLPLHCVVKSEVCSYETLQMSRDDRLCKVMSKYCHAVSISDSNGNYPIMSVAKIRPLWNYAILKFLKIEPKVLFLKDPDYQFYPFQLISMSCDGKSTNQDQGQEELFTLFQCIRACPELVKQK